ncbi:hypothetical protein X882_5190 [Burkholderia pseudomallei MSHR4303]|nr:hypothetical protein X882_5190 [Burkholderia pseudomallei MSHR4303]
MKRRVGIVAPSSKNMSSSSAPKSGSSICDDDCIAFDVSPILCPFSTRPSASFMSTHVRWIAYASSIVISG